ncbi:hypothetical protein [Candidatus Reidiella endopervernicosa]|uniref:Uncharacterized protein n=1 Tax=Candidatus Reidiella endopervernicosa TaxID=2738883 RepID=A0A6N0HZ24_9GAMM|nr:hypothetical protein [Candidatus Reidiella endopervernicosa]QKQ27622.1 hypothetical protein HUE57_15980 [Candidatus Reidiella endopervernicosa]
MNRYETTEHQDEVISRSTEEQHIEQLQKQGENFPSWMAVDDEERLRHLAQAGAGGSY